MQKDRWQRETVTAVFCAQGDALLFSTKQTLKSTISPLAPPAFLPPHPLLAPCKPLLTPVKTRVGLAMKTGSTQIQRYHSGTLALLLTSVNPQTHMKINTRPQE